MKHVSVLSVLIRSSFYKVLMVTAFMIAVGVFKFYKFIGGGQGSLMNAEQMLEEINFADNFRLAVAIVFMILCVTENRLDKNSGNTLLRLRITTKQFFVLKTLYNAFCIAFLFVVQICVAIVFIKLYEEHVGTDILGTQQLFLAFYRNEALHNILPMAEVGKWIRNIFLITAYAMQAAVCGKKNYVTDIWICIFFDMYMRSEIGINLTEMFADLTAVIIIATVLLKVFGAFSDDERE